MIKKYLFINNKIDVYMEKIIISESFKNRMQKLAGILQENAQKIMRLGFDEQIAEFLSRLNKKRGIFFANILTKEYIRDNSLSDLSGLDVKQALSSINQEELFDYIKSKESDIVLILDWIKENQGQINLKEFENFNDIVDAANEYMDVENQSEDSGVNFNEKVEQYLRRLEYDFGIDLGVLALKDYVKHEHPEIDINNENINSILQKIDEDRFLDFLKRNENELNTIIVWVNSETRQEEEGVLIGDSKSQFIKGKNFIDLQDALATADTWHTNLTASGVIRDPYVGRIVERYSNGYYWIDLDTNYSLDEGQAMGHCGSEPKATTLISLRDKNGGPHVTVAYNENEKNVLQVKGKENRKPNEKYMNYVTDFLQKMVKSGNLTRFQWSYPTHGADLNDREVAEILKANKRLYFNYLKKGINQSVSNIGVRY